MRWAGGLALGRASGPFKAGVVLISTELAVSVVPEAEPKAATESPTQTLAKEAEPALGTDSIPTRDRSVT